MSSMSDTLRLLQDEFLIVIGVMIGIPVCYFGSKVWKGNASLTLILGSGLAVVSVLGYLVQHHWRLPFSDRALMFFLLYIWCALGLWFVAGQQVSRVKLFLGFIAEAGVVYAVYKYI